MRLKRTGILFVLSAPSGAGKTSIRERLLKRMPDIVYSVSYTTRPPRSMEREGFDYHFISRPEFLQMIEANDFIEWAEVHGNLYGTALPPLERAVAQGIDALLDIDVQGAEQIQSRYKGGTVVTIFIMPPSLEILQNRLSRRGSESKADQEKRLQKASQEMQRFKDYNYVVVNRDLERAADQVASIVEAERCRSDLYGALQELLQPEI